LIGHFDHSDSCRAYWRSRIGAMPTTRRILECQREAWARHPRKARPAALLWFVGQAWIRRKIFRNGVAAEASQANPCGRSPHRLIQ
jgi:hypothetical protein